MAVFLLAVLVKMIVLYSFCCNATQLQHKCIKLQHFCNVDIEIDKEQGIRRWDWSL